MTDFVWLGVAVVAAIVEAIVPSLVSVWFVPGGLVALGASLAGGPLWLQILLFVVVSLVLLALTRPLARRLVDRHRERTNADRALGAVGIVIQDIDNVLGTGRVVVLGLSWNARSTQPEGKIAAGARVRVEKITGATLLVAPAEEPSSEEKGA